MRSRLTWAVLAVLLAVGCGHGAPPPDAGVDAGPIGCKNDPRVEAYAPGISKMGIQGTLRFELSASDPAPPSRGTNVWTVRTLGAGGAPVDVTLTATPFMPDHGHGSSVVPQITKSADGYRIEALYLFMPGVWRVLLDAQGAQSDAAAFYFCIAG
jgi:hypothetical protein